MLKTFFLCHCSESDGTWCSFWTLNSWLVIHFELLLYSGIYEGGCTSKSCQQLIVNGFESLSHGVDKVSVQTLFTVLGPVLYVDIRQRGGGVRWCWTWNDHQSVEEEDKRRETTCGCVVTATVLELWGTVHVKSEPAELLLQVVVLLWRRLEGLLGVVRGDWGGNSVGLVVVLRLLLHCTKLLLSFSQQRLQQLRGGLHVVRGRAVLGAALLWRTLLVGRGRLGQFLVESWVWAGASPPWLRGWGEVGGDQGGGVVVPLTVRRAALPPPLSGPVPDSSSSSSSSTNTTSGTSCSSHSSA